jgi:hypothetical protein
MVLAAVVALHLLLTFYFERPDLIFSEEPNGWLDFDTHINQAWVVTEALDEWGEIWAYDPQVLAGFPHGVIFNADNKGWELWTYALWKLGLPRGTAFNTFILLSHLLAPWVLFAAARLFRLDRWASLTAAVLSMALWHFDAFPHWCWWIGMIAWGIVGYLAVLPVGLLYRYLDDGKLWRAIAAALVMAAAHLIHPYVFIAIAVPMIALYLRSFRRIPLGRHLGVWGIALFTLAANAFWVIEALRYWHYILDSGYCFQGSLFYVVTDLLGLIGPDPLVSGVLSNRTLFRLICLASAVFALVRWRRERDDRLLPLASALIVGFAITYLGGYVWITKQIQPYRFILPTIFFLVIPAAWFLTRAVRSIEWRRLPGPALAVFGLVIFVAVPALARDVLYYFPRALPSLIPLHEVMPSLADKIDRFVPGTGFHKQMELRHTPHYQDFNDVSGWLRKNDDGQGRVLIEWYVLGEHLAWRTDTQILGGFHERNLVHTAADLFRRDEDGNLPEHLLRRYFEDYAVKWVILTWSRPELEKHTDLLEPLGGFPPYDEQGLPFHRIYKVKLPVSFFAENDGLVDASLNRIEVTGTDPDHDVVLRFHWLETLVCREGCEIVREPVSHDPVGFIRVPAPHPADFTIVNAY